MYNHIRKLQRWLCLWFDDTDKVPVVLSQNIVPHNIFSRIFCLSDHNPNKTLTKLSVVEQDVSGAKSLGNSALGQDVGHQKIKQL